MKRFSLSVKKGFLLKFLEIFLILFLFSAQSFSKDKDNNKVSDNYELSQNYPNPFNPTTKISYSIPKESFVKIEVYNMLGNKIAVLVNEEQKAGAYSITFNASDLPSGVYFYRLQADNFILTKKLTVLK